MQFGGYGDQPGLVETILGNLELQRCSHLLQSECIGTGWQELCLNGWVRSIQACLSTVHINHHDLLWQRWVCWTGVCWTVVQ